MKYKKIIRTDRTDSVHFHDSRMFRAECGIYPTGLTADTVEYPEHQAVDGEQVIVDN